MPNIGEGKGLIDTHYYYYYFSTCTMTVCGSDPCVFKEVLLHWDVSAVPGVTAVDGMLP